MFWEILLLVVLLIPVLAILLDSQVGKALAARLERGGPVEGDRLLERLQALESEVDRLSTEVERLDEEGEFLQKLLAERPPPDTGGGSKLLSGDAED